MVNIDKLLNDVKSNNIHIKFNGLYKLGDYYYDNNYDESLKYYKDAYELYLYWNRNKFDYKWSDNYNEMWLNIKDKKFKQILGKITSK